MLAIEIEQLHYLGRVKRVFVRSVPKAELRMLHHHLIETMRERLHLRYRVNWLPLWPSKQREQIHPVQIGCL